LSDRKLATTVYRHYIGVHKGCIMNIEDLIRKLDIPSSEPDAEFLRSVYTFAEKAHYSGVSSIEHPLATAVILAELQFDIPTLAAALLHDLPEYTDLSLEKIELAFGPEIAGLVDAAATLNHISWENLQDEQAENLREMFLTMADDVRVVLIRLAEQLHKMQILSSYPVEERRSIACETLQVFAPLADRLGIWRLKWRLEDQALSHLNPQAYQRITTALNDCREIRENRIEKIVGILRKELKEARVPAKVTGRSKHIASIYKKMERTAKDLTQIYDIQGIRIIVSDVTGCYATLGIIQHLWPQIPGEFDDYIARPKTNLYRSLHTAVLGPDQTPLEIQIRTQQMHETAELGLAAHWKYKARIEHESRIDPKIIYLRNLLEWRKELVSYPETGELSPDSVFPLFVYVFSPNEDVIDLPEGSTPIDFAYRIHSEIGHRCRGARINGKLVALNTPLRNADRIEIITSKSSHPSRDWLNPQNGYIRTSKARQHIRSWFRRQDREKTIVHGRELIDRELKRAGLRQKSYDEISRLFDYAGPEPFLEDIGRGTLSAQHAASRLAAETTISTPFPSPDVLSQKKIESPQVTVKGLKDLLTRVAHCCYPLPGDDIVGFITRGRGLTIHRRDCSHVLQPADWKRLIDVEWSQSETRSSVPVLVEGTRSGSLPKQITEIVEKMDAKILSSSVHRNPQDDGISITATIEIGNATQLNAILRKIKALPNVMEVRRLLPH